ncbi:hypothetical protein [Bartonella sp. DGB1]|uniref:hypothetical protein n=1 Tax=Bartonella sp. DGB1 TaxID=3239807 RepID=UPI0035261D39
MNNYKIITILISIFAVFVKIFNLGKKNEKIKNNNKILKNVKARSSVELEINKENMDNIRNKLKKWKINYEKFDKK